MRPLRNIATVLIALLLSIGSYAQNRPYSMANGGTMDELDWSIEKYIANAEMDSLRSIANRDKQLALAEEKRMTEVPEPEEATKLFSKKREAKNNQEKAEEAFVKNKIEYKASIAEINSQFDEEIKAIQEYRDNWVAYLSAEEARKEEERNNQSKAERAFQEKAEEKRKAAIAEAKAMPTNPNYVQWNSKYEGSLSNAKANVDNCQAIINKYTYRNDLGQKIFDSSDFSPTDKKLFNANLESLGKHNEAIKELENNNKYYGYWADVADIEKGTMSFKLSSYYNNTGKAY